MRPVGARPGGLVDERLAAVDARSRRRPGSGRSPGRRRAACRTARGPSRTATVISSARSAPPIAWAASRMMPSCITAFQVAQPEPAAPMRSPPATRTSSKLDLVLRVGGEAALLRERHARRRADRPGRGRRRSSPRPVRASTSRRVGRAREARRGASRRRARSRRRRGFGRAAARPSGRSRRRARARRASRIASPDAIFGSHACFCSSLPAASSAPAPTSDARRSAASARARGRTPRRRSPPRAASAPAPP